MSPQVQHSIFSFGNWIDILFTQFTVNANVHCISNHDGMAVAFQRAIPLPEGGRHLVDVSLLVPIFYLSVVSYAAV